MSAAREAGNKNGASTGCPFYQNALPEVPLSRGLPSAARTARERRTRRRGGSLFRRQLAGDVADYFLLAAVFFAAGFLAAVFLAAGFFAAGFLATAFFFAGLAAAFFFAGAFFAVLRTAALANVLLLILK